MPKNVLSYAVAFLAAFVVAGVLVFVRGTDKPGAGAAAEADAPREFAVEGMSCEACVEAITASLKAVPGVRSAKVLLEEKKAVVVADPAAVPDDKLVATINALGYMAKVAGK